MRNLLKIIICLSVILLAGSVVNSMGVAQTVSKEAGDFKLKSIKGDTISLSDFKGEQPVILEFWATWCPYCVDGMKHMKEIYPRLKVEGFEVLAINVQESEAKASGFASKQGIQFPVLLDSSGAVAKEYGVRGIPAVFIINKDGKKVFTGHEVPDNYLELVE